MLTSRPLTRIVPASGSRKPAIIRKVVVLPQPLPPSRAIISPSAACSSSPLTAVNAPKRLVRWFSSSVAMGDSPYFTNMSRPTNFSMRTISPKEPNIKKVDTAASVGSKVSSI